MRTSLILAAGGLAACARQAPVGAVVVGFSQIAGDNDWRTAETRSIQEEAKKRGIDLRFSDAQDSLTNQIMALRSFVSQRVKAIILAPKVETGWDPVLKEARDAGIPVILVDRGVKVSDESLYATLLASDFVEEGRMAARWLADKTGGKADIVELQGTTGAAPAIDRKRGFEEELKRHPDMKIIKSQSADFKQSEGKKVMENIVKSERDRIQAVYAHNDNMALGAIQALDEAGMKPGEKVLVVSIDAVRPAFEAMIAGKLNASVECNPLFGPAAFEVVAKLLKGERVPKFIKSEDRLFDQSNAARFLPSRAY